MMSSMPVVTWFAEVLDAVRDVWAFRLPDVLVDAPDDAWPIALGVAMLAALSTMIGHSVVYAINHVRGLRMVAAMALGVGYSVALRLVMAVTIAVLSWAVTGVSAIGGEIGYCYLLALAPLVLSFLIFVPHFGLFLGRVLEGWALLCMVALLSPTLGVGMWAALGLAGGAWLVTQVLSRVLAGPLASVSSRLWSLATGHDTYLTARDILSGAPFIPLEQQERHA